MSPVPSGTYRLQITPSFQLTDAAEIVDYLDALGVSHAYTSPLLAAAAGSEHGYDVVSHTEVGSAIGGEAGRQALVEALRARGLGLVVDIVPNHMGVANAEENAQWWDVLKLGPQSIYARWFDIDWIEGRVLLPVLGDDADLERDLRIEDGELRYFEHRFPLSPGTDPSDQPIRPGQPDAAMTPAEAHSHQHYQLVNWREADTTQNYRRFFAVTTLAGIKVEDPIVFEATHRLFTQWVAAGEADGLRIDHPDGLADPLGYLTALRAAAPEAWITVEKITEPGETLPAAWPVAGMTGYDALTEVTDLVVDPAGQDRFDVLDARLAGAALVAAVRAGRQADDRRHDPARGVQPPGPPGPRCRWRGRRAGRAGYRLPGLPQLPARGDARTWTRRSRWPPSAGRRSQARSTRCCRA